MDREEPTKLLILWTSGDREVALNMVMMYADNSVRNGWWEHVTLVLWGPSQRVLAADKEVQAEVKKLQGAGVRVMACIACAERYGLTDALKSYGLEVFGMGPVLTNWLKSEGRIMTF